MGAILPVTFWREFSPRISTNSQSHIDKLGDSSRPL